MSAKVVNLNAFAEELAGYGKAFTEELRDASIEGVIRSMESLVEMSPVDTGEYANSWGVDIKPDKVVIGNYAPHAPIIEYGARPFTPPIAPLLEWAKRVLRDSSQGPGYSKEVWALAKATQAKISKVGMAPKKVMERGIPIIMKNIEAEWRRRGLL